MDSIGILLDIPEVFQAQAKYCLENLLFPVKAKIVFVANIEELKAHRFKLLYCSEHSLLPESKVLGRDTAVVILEDRTLSYFSSYRSLDKSFIRIAKNILELFPTSSNHTYTGKRLSFDIVAAAFFFLSCWQEYYISQRDWKGRIPLNSTIQSQYDMVRKPIVNQYLNRLIAIWGNKLEKKAMPGGHDVYVALSHDIDYVDWPISKYLDVFRTSHYRDLITNRVWRSIRNAIGKKYILNQIKNLEMAYQVASTWYFFSKYTPSGLNQYARQMIRSLDGTSFEVGHHIRDESIFNNSLGKDCKEFKPLVRVLYGTRVHTLRFEVNSLLNQLEAHEYLYDNSMLFAENIGYRTGFTYPHYIFDPKRIKPFEVVVIPLNIMDGSLVDSKYLSLKDPDAEKELLGFFKSVIPFGGSISMLFHNNFFYFNTINRFKMYERLLGFFVKAGIRVGPVRDLYLWRKGIVV